MDVNFRHEVNDFLTQITKMTHDNHPFVTDETPLLTPAHDPVGDLRKAYRRPVLLFAFTAIFMVEVAVSLFQPAAIAIEEINICHAEFPYLEPGGDHAECQTGQVSGRLAMLQGWQYMAESFPGPYIPIP